LRDLIVPLRKTYEYKCKDAKITVDGKLPDGFKFDSKTGTLTYLSDDKPIIDTGYFKLKATAKDGRTTSIVVNYFSFTKDQLGDHDCVAILDRNQPNPIVTFDVVVSDRTLTGFDLDPVNFPKPLTQAIYLQTKKEITKIGQYFFSEVG
jgi:hypothetical protein